MKPSATSAETIIDLDVAPWHRRQPRVLPVDPPGLFQRSSINCVARAGERAFWPLESGGDRRAVRATIWRALAT